MSIAPQAKKIDSQMERASSALAQMDFFQAERIAASCLNLAHNAGDFERMARICMPLEEARRQKRLAAIDAANTVVRSSLPRGRSKLEPGCCLVQPPLVGANVGALRLKADRRGVPVLFVTREPLTRAGKWPVVAVSPAPLTIRAYIDPPVPLERIESSPSKDTGESVPTVSWFLKALDALTDAALAKIKTEDPPAWQVADLVDCLDALPDSDLLHQKLAAVCQEALHAPEPEGSRRRPLVEDDGSF